MTYNKKNNVQYKIALDTKNNVFMAIDPKNQHKKATGATIEQAIAQFKQLIKE
ncbi:hypothetical protein QQG09_03685 [Melissococcus plutonius]|uniref:Uncharacterized protein n=2 Tax=Melissococcus plutonius TaxID=33970 RepID=F3YA23_MELPT|nr:hypothetical protein [Melissococcus plutonius]BAL62275.1 hypothetical protein MPD5_1050 [Melissococcus plutonius DAT561]AIM24861.1 hypothetical protein MEPL_c007890 [Melissococcus plutonius S1]KMT24992.1 hypothetical protein MEPL2_2c05360 [Melissococcus plutonius]KMT26628.1 hypothetical protein MEPL3_2c02990 [Melissococcus plutonius]KMT27878.1 hypothetical protein MEPL1_3c05290 [Melissococcus plutonius]